MKKLENLIALSQKKSICLNQGSHSNKHLALALNAEISSLGFFFNKKAVKVIASQSQEDIKELKSFLVQSLKEMVGDHVVYTPLFVNFPEDVPNQEEYLNKRLVGYFTNFFGFENENSEKLSCGHFVDSRLFDLDLFGACPICQMQTDRSPKAKIRSAFKEEVKYKELSIINEGECISLIKDMLSSNVVYSPVQRSLILDLIEEYKTNTLELIPKKFLVKENLSFISACLIKNSLSVELSQFDNFTDILRLSVALSFGDISLKEKNNFVLKNKERKIILNLLNQKDMNLEDLLRNREKLLRLGEYLHIASYKELSYANKYFDLLRNNEKSIDTFNKKVHKEVLAFKDSKNAKHLLEVLEKRPSELARKLDFILRQDESGLALKAFGDNIHKVSSRILYTLYKHFENRSEKTSVRAFIPKGDSSKMFLISEDSRETIPVSLIKSVKDIVEKEILNRFSHREFKNIYIDKNMEDVLVPFSIRSLSKSVETFERGSSVSFNKDCQTLRMFLYWKDISSPIDVDLSAIAYDENWNYKTHLDWTSLESLNCKHSGDVRSAPNGAAEFIDLNLKSLRKSNIRYIAMNVYSFSGQKYASFESFAGFMERENSKEGQIFEPKSVKNKFDLTAESTVCIPVYFDLVEGKMVIADISISSQRFARAGSSTEKVAQMCKAIGEMKKYKMNLKDLFSLHAKSCGANVDFIKKEGQVYDLEIDKDFALKNINEILANWI